MPPGPTLTLPRSGPGSCGAGPCHFQNRFKVPRQPPGGPRTGSYGRCRARNRKNRRREPKDCGQRAFATKTVRRTKSPKLSQYKSILHLEKYKSSADLPTQPPAGNPRNQHHSKNTQKLKTIYKTCPTNPQTISTTLQKPPTNLQPKNECICNLQNISKPKSNAF